MTIPSVSRRFTLLAAGDLEWRSDVEPWSLLLDFRDSHDGWLPLPLVRTKRTPGPDALKDAGATDVELHANESQKHPLSFDDKVTEARYPFLKLLDELRSADLTFANLEMPLSSRAQKSGAFLASAEFAQALRWAGVDVVSLANNHTFDAGEWGLADTLESLRLCGIGSVGAGPNLPAATKPFLKTVGNFTIGLLGYDQLIGLAGRTAFAGASQAGVAPLSPDLVCDDIRRLRKKADAVVVSCHWGQENSFEVQPMARRLAHRFFDAGADVILGHHPHVPQGVEVRDGKVVFYSLGNFVFGHGHDYWDDNILARINFVEGQVAVVDILPIAGHRADVAQPRLLRGPRAQRLLRLIKARSRELDTTVTIQGNVGRLRLGGTR